jgi:hypothetical protein
MITTLIITLSALTLVSFYSLARALRHAPDGYEDENGFHHGVAPAPRLATVHVVSFNEREVRRAA